jgi:hypothetical protein
MLGRSAHYQVEASRHYTNEFAVLVGASAKARKGSSLDQVLSVMRVIDPDWAERRLASGLSTGEGLIWKLRDSGDDDAGGDQDKRLLVIEAEFASVLKVAKRQDSTLSAIVRNAWDGKALETITKTSPARASEAHISLIGHITRDELARNVDATEIANGFLNRFMHFAVRSSKVLPFGGEVESVDFGDVIDQLGQALTFGRKTERLRFADEAREIWPQHYTRLRDGHHGMLGAVTARSEAHVVRLSILYALLDSSDEIRVDHLRAALALWTYSEHSARWIYGYSLGDPLADELWNALARRPEGMSRTEIRDWFSRNKRRSDIDRALAVISDAGLARRQRIAKAPGAVEVEMWIPAA